MRIDQKGRVAIAADVRERLSLGPGATVWVEADRETIRLTPVRQSRRKVVELDGWPVIAPGEGHTVTDADVQRWRHTGQR